MECRYCAYFQNAKWRVNPDADETGKKKNQPKLRHCSIAAKYIPGEQQICDHFEPHPLFWCDKSVCWLAVGACIVRQQNKDEDCNHCRQAKLIVDLKRALKFLERKQALADAAAEGKPVLIKRKI